MASAVPFFTMKNLTVIIPNFNGEQLLPICLDSLKNQKYKDFKTIIVDDASEDNSVEIAKKYNAKILVNEYNMGFAASVNRGIEEADTDYVLLLNNDVELKDPDFLTMMVNTIDTDERIFSVSPKMIRYYEPETIDDTGDEYTLFGWVYKRGDGDPVSDYMIRDYVFSSCAGAGIYRRDLLLQLGNFDINHFAYLEDVDLGWKALIEGYRNVYQPKAKCYHIGSATLAGGNKYSSKKVYYSARNNIYIIYKNMPFFQFCLNSPFIILGFLIKLLYFTLQGYDDDYLEGLKCGLMSMQKLKKVEFKPRNFKNYLFIQCKMTYSTFNYVGEKIGKIVSRGWNRLKGIVRRKKLSE